MDVSLGRLTFAGCPHSSIQGKDVFSDKEAIRLFNPRYVSSSYQYDNDGWDVFQCLDWLGGQFFQTGFQGCLDMFGYQELPLFWKVCISNIFLCFPFLVDENLRRMVKQGFTSSYLERLERGKKFKEQVFTRDRFRAVGDNTWADFLDGNMEVRGNKSEVLQCIGFQRVDSQPRIHIERNLVECHGGLLPYPDQCNVGT